MPALPTFPIPSLRVRAWPDSVIDAVGHDLRSAYVEQFWLGILGPTSTLLLRRLATGLDASPDGFELDLPATAAELGIGHRSGRHAPFLRSIERCCRFGATRVVGDDLLQVRRKLPPLSRLQVARLPRGLQEAHQVWLAGPSIAPPAAEPADVRERARGLALSLLEAHDDPKATERQLHRWGLHPALAHDAVAWATAHRSRSVAPSEHTSRPPEAA
ncbi:MAG: hypothetical protein ACSLFP_00140 [Acidimicrobiales bacterium]